MKKNTWNKVCEHLGPAYLKAITSQVTGPQMALLEGFCRILDNHEANLRLQGEQIDWLRERADEEDEGDEQPETDDPAFMEDESKALHVLAAALKDLAENGLRTDLTPTKRMRHGDEGWDENEKFWHTYLKRADDYVRAFAREKLEEAGV
jgi:hypothetical protein